MISKVAIWLIPIICLLFFETLADYLSGLWIDQSKDITWAILSAFVYLLSAISWLIAMRLGVGLSRGTIIISVLSGLLTVAMGMIVFHEKLSPRQTIGAIFALVSFILIMSDA